MRLNTAIIGWAEMSAGFVSLGTGRQLWVAGAVTLVFATLARWVRGVDTSGAIAGAAACFTLYAGAGPGAFVALVTVFVLAWLTTRLGYGRKQRLGVAEKRVGRKASQVLANLAVAAVCAALYAWSGVNACLLGLVAALSEAAADTVSSEIGQVLSTQARLVTSWKIVPAGTDGAITLAGTLAGLAAAAIVAGVSVATSLISWRGLCLCLFAGVLGMLIDSFLGAWLERRHLLNNDAVNFLGTLSAAGIAISWAFLLSFQ